MKITWDWFLRSTQIAGMAFLLISLPLSNYFMSLSSFFLVGAWILDLGTMIYQKESIVPRLRNFWNNRAAKVLTSLYLMVVIGTFYSSHLDHAWWDLKMKLPFLFTPLLICGLRPVSANTFRSLLMLFISSLVVAVTICVMVYYGIIEKEWNDVREISIFISHIRFSLLLVFGIAILLFLFIKEKKWRYASLLILAYFSWFLWIIESITGFTVLMFVLTWYVWYQFAHSKYKFFKYSLPLIFVAGVSMVGWYLRSCYSEYFTVRDSPKPVATHSRGGEVYFNDTTNLQIENGYYIMRYIAWYELSDSWTKRSDIPFDGTDKLGNPIKGTLVRYLTSLGLRKDMDGVAALSDEQIRLIENGVTSAGARQKGIRGRINKILFEYDAYVNGANPSGHSVLQRLEFWKAARGIISENFWFGVGTGDVKAAFADEYAKMHTRLDDKHRLRAHNQYLTFWISGGIIGLIWFLIVLIYPLFPGKNWRDPLYVSLLIIVILSCVTEDTLETQAGVTFFIFFSSFLLFLQRTPADNRPPVRD